MRTLAFDGRMGASGDMILAALLAAGADRDALAPVEDALDVRYVVGETEKNGIAATTVDVLLTGDAAAADPAADGDGRDTDGDHDSDGDNHDSGEDDHGHGHDHSSDDDGHGHGHEHAHGPHVHAEGRGPTRTYAEVVDVVESMALPDAVEADALDAFRLLGEAEAAVHGTDLADTHFHEVGADDAIADVVGAALLLADLDPVRVVTTPVSAGGGTVETSHGTYPVPTPAVVELAGRADWELRGGPVEAELVTPTGAAVLASVAEGVEALPAMRVEASGYGAGGYRFDEYPNVLRVVVGEARGGLVRDDIRVLETNLDDATPETLGSLQESLAEAGARDVTVLPATGKKSRPGHLVKVVVKPEDTERVARRLAAETGTLGVRDTGVRHRHVARRRFVTATVPVDGTRHDVAVKVATDDGGAVLDVSAEHDDAARVAAETDLAVREVARRAETAAREAGALSEHLVHVLPADAWAAVADGDAPPEYRPDSLDEEGYVHLSPPARAAAAANANPAFEDADLRVLVLDRARLEATGALRYEEGPDGAFPHLYAPLPTDAVVDVRPLPREDGRYVLPEDLAA